VTKEEIFRELREYCKRRSTCANTARVIRKAFYLPTCEYCFSHWVAAFFLLITDFRLLLPGWRGFLIALFAVVLIANVYLTIYSLGRVALRWARAEADKASKAA
jgi:hypothetical protein